MSNTHRLQVLVPPSLHARITTEAQRARVSRGEWVRRAIERQLAQRGEVTDPVAAMAALNAPTCDIDQMIEESVAGRDGGMPDE